MSVRLYEDMYHKINDVIKYRDMVNKILTCQKPKEKGCFDVSFSLKILHITFFVYSCSELSSLLSLLSFSHSFLYVRFKVASLISYWLKIANLCVKRHVARCFTTRNYRDKTCIGLPLRIRYSQVCCLFTMYLNSITGRILNCRLNILIYQ